MTNVILISLDTVRADHLSCYGYGKRTTPNIDALAADGTVFLQNYSTGVWTPPGHASMLTGLYVSEHGVYGTRRLAEGVPTIAEVLKRHGYRTAGFVNNSQVGELVGLEKGHERFVEVWKGLETDSIVERAISGLLRKTKEALGQTDMGAAQTNREFAEWLDAAGGQAPFYAFLHYIEPHNPLNPPQPFRNRCLKDAPKDVDMEKIKKIAHNPLVCFIEDLKPTDAEIAYLTALYDGEIEYTDGKVGEVVELLKQKGLYDDTMIIITADHGEHFGEYGLWSHCASLYREVLRIPLVMKFPKGISARKKVDGYTQLVDIFPTVMEATGVSGKENIKTSGVSLVPNGANRYHEYVFAEWEGRVPSFIEARAGEGADLERIKVQMAAIQDKKRKYVWKSDGTEALFDVSDGRETPLDIASEKGARDALRAELMRRKKDLSEGASEERAMDADIEKNLKSLGYL